MWANYGQVQLQHTDGCKRTRNGTHPKIVQLGTTPYTPRWWADQTQGIRLDYCFPELRLEIGSRPGFWSCHENGGFCEEAAGCQVNFHSQPKMFQISKKLPPEHVKDLTLDNFHSWIFSIYRSGIFPFLTQDLSDINCGWEVVGLPCGVIVMEARPLIGRLLFQGGN